MKQIRTEADYEAALARIDKLLGADKGSAEAQELDMLATAVEAYEEIVFPIAPPPFAAALQFRMEQGGLRAVDVARITGISRNRVSELLSGKREPSKEQIRTLHAKLGIPLQHLLDVEAEATKEMQNVAAEFKTEVNWPTELPVLEFDWEWNNAERSVPSYLQPENSCPYASPLAGAV